MLSKESPGSPLSAQNRNYVDHHKMFGAICVHLKNACERVSASLAPTHSLAYHLVNLGAEHTVIRTLEQIGTPGVSWREGGIHSDGCMGYGSLEDGSWSENLNFEFEGLDTKNSKFSNFLVFWVSKRNMKISKKFLKNSKNQNFINFGSRHENLNF